MVRFRFRASDRVMVSVKVMVRTSNKLGVRVRVGVRI